MIADRIRRKTTLVQARPVFFPPKENIKQNKKKSQLLHCETCEEKYHTIILPRVWLKTRITQNICSLKNYDTSNVIYWTKVSVKLLIGVMNWNTSRDFYTMLQVFPLIAVFYFLSPSQFLFYSSLKSHFCQSATNHKSRLLASRVRAFTNWI